MPSHQTESVIVSGVPPWAPSFTGQCGRSFVGGGDYSHLCSNTGSICVAIAFVVTGTSGGRAELGYVDFGCVGYFRHHLSCTLLCNNLLPASWTFISSVIADCQSSATYLQGKKGEFPLLCEWRRFSEFGPYCYSQLGERTLSYWMLHLHTITQRGQ